MNSGVVFYIPRSSIPLRPKAGAVTQRFRTAPRAPSASARDDAPQYVVHQATVVAEAAMLAAARVQVSHHGSAEVPARAGTLQSISRPQLMVRLSRALSSSPIVARARRQAAARVATSHD